MYQAVFSQEQPGMPKKESEHRPLRISTDAYNYALDFQNLPPQEREIVATLVRMLKKNNRSTMHVTRFPLTRPARPLQSSLVS